MGSTIFNTGLPYPELVSGQTLTLWYETSIKAEATKIGESLPGIRGSPYPPCGGIPNCGFPLPNLH
jgi:hypothetical protein